MKHCFIGLIAFQIISGRWDSQRSSIMVSWLSMPQCIKRIPHREWGHNRAHVHAGLVIVLCK